jgi:hypothetical protein
MIESSTFRRVTVAALVASALILAVYASCPNACSGNGLCGENDMCECYRNWAGADCSQRVCPFAFSHVTTPQGDLNMDGDTNDNSFRRIPSVSGFVKVTHESVVVTMTNAAGADAKLDVTDPGGIDLVEPAEGHTTLQPGDAVSINGEMFLIATHTANTATFTITTTTVGNGLVGAEKYKGATDTRAVAYKVTPTINVPQGDWESWVGDFARALTAGSTNGLPIDEGHFYMECSNRGLCDRKAGVCKCFPGYDGAACQRTTCPNDCSGHGTCEKVSELRKLQPQVIPGCTVSGVQGSLDLVTDVDCRAATITYGFSAGDLLLVGDTTTTYTVAASGSGAALIKLAAGQELKKAYPAGTPVYVQPKYGLWDADKNRACKCDARYSGYDCSERKCPVGDDPMTVDQQFETQILTIGGADPQNYVGGLNSKLVGTTGIKLVFEDMYGEKWTTTQIPVNGITDHTSDVASALTALPNEIIQGVTVTYDPISTNGIRYYIKFNGGTTGPKACNNRKCPSYTSTGNSGDLPTMGCDNSELLVRMESHAASTDYVGTFASATKKFTFTTALASATATLAVGDLVSGWTATGGTITVSSQDLQFGTKPAAGTFQVGDWVATFATAVPKGLLQVTAVTPTTGAATLDSITVVGTIDAGVNLVKYRVGDAVVTASTVSTGTITIVDISKDLAGITDLIPLRYVKGGVECTVSDIALIQPATWAAAYEAGAATQNSYTFTFDADVTANSVKIGDQLYLYKDASQSQIVTVADRVGAVITTVEQITQAYANSDKVYFYGKGTTEKKECSGRGLCDVGSGQCKCFAGYTMDDCSRQSALAK